MATTPVCSISAAGIAVPTYSDCLTYFRNGFLNIYGVDSYIEPDAQDAQLLSIFSLALSDANNEAASVYNAFSPVTAQGAGLSSVVKVNGITRKIPTYSTVDGLVVGQYGTTITNGLVSDGTYVWALPATVTIPAAGQITVTAICTTLGAIELPASSINTAQQVGSIVTPTLGWQSFQTTDDAVPGAPVETDAQLRQRQALSTANPSQSILDGMTGAILGLSGVSSCTIYENTSDVPDSNGIPGHTISAVVLGGDATQIATTIANRKSSATYGTTVVPITDQYGITKNISFYRPTVVQTTYAIGIKPLPGFTAAIQNAIVTALVNWVNGLSAGQVVYLNRAYVPIALTGAQANTFEITYLYMARDGVQPAPADIPIAFNEQAQTNSALVSVALITT